MIYQYIYDPEANGLDVSLADVNKDEKVTNADVLMMLRYIYDPIRYPIA